MKTHGLVDVEQLLLEMQVIMTKLFGVFVFIYYCFASLLLAVSFLDIDCKGRPVS